MKTSLPRKEIAPYLRRQLDHFFPDGGDTELTSIVDIALERLELCFSPVKLRWYQIDGEPYFNHLHSDHYATFVYLASNVAFRQGRLDLAAKLYGLNKALNGFMCTYDTNLPPHFLVIHTVGMLLGKATYSDYFVALHTVAIGTDRSIEPTIGRSVVVYGGTSIIGDCKISENVSISAQTLIRNQGVPPNSVVAGRSPDLVIKPAKRSLIHVYYDESKMTP